MAAPLAPVLWMLGRSLATALRKWPNILALGTLLLAGGFSVKLMLKQMGETALSLWPLLALACFFFLLKEVVKAWVQIRKNEVEAKRES